MAAVMAFLSMDSLEDEPSTELIPDLTTAWMLPDSKWKKQLQIVCEAIVTNSVDFRYHDILQDPIARSTKSISDSNSDRVHQYASQILSLGCFYLEFCDCIRDGAGAGVIFYQYLEAVVGRIILLRPLYYLCQNCYLFSPQLASQLLWSRTVNVHGQVGKNIPGNLLMEHLNRVAKECISHLDAGKTPKAIYISCWNNSPSSGSVWHH